MDAESGFQRPDSHLGADGATDGTTEFRSTPKQLRNLLIATVIAFGATVVAGFIAVGATTWGGAADIAVTAGPCCLLGLYSYLSYTFAHTVFGPQGIRGTSLTGRYECEWAQIANVACRVYTSRGVTTYTIILTTTAGDRIRLGAPVAGGLMGDPAFAAKYAQIRGAWQSATGRTGPDVDTKSIWTRGFALLFAGLMLQCIAVAVIVSLLSYDGPAIAAHEGKGVPGVFTAEIHNCPQPRCTWFGTFASDGVEKYATLAPGGPVIAQANVIVSAVDTGARYTVYPVGGGTAWQAPVAGAATAGAGVLVILVAELATWTTWRRRRQRRIRAAPAG